MKVSILWSLALTLMPAHAGPIINFVGLPDSGVTLYASTSSEFKHLITARIDAGSLKQIEPILPYCVLLVNDSSSDLIAVVVGMDWQHSSGISVSSDMMYSTMTVDNLIPRGAAILVTPVSGLNRELPPNLIMSFGNYDVAEQVAERRMTLEVVKALTITLDSVAFADGSLVSSGAR